MPTFTVSIKESAELPFLGKQSFSKPIFHLDVSPEIAAGIESGAVSVRLPGADQGTGTVLDAQTEVPVPVIGHIELELVVKVAA